MTRSEIFRMLLDLFTEIYRRSFCSETSWRSAVSLFQKSAKQLAWRWFYFSEIIKHTQILNVHKHVEKRRSEKSQMKFLFNMLFIIKSMHMPLDETSHFSPWKIKQTVHKQEHQSALSIIFWSTWWWWWWPNIITVYEIEASYWL